MEKNIELKEVSVDATKVIPDNNENQYNDEVFSVEEKTMEMKTEQEVTPVEPVEPDVTLTPKAVYSRFVFNYLVCN